MAEPGLARLRNLLVQLERALEEGAILGFVQSKAAKTQAQAGKQQPRLAPKESASPSQPIPRLLSEVPGDAVWKEFRESPRFASLDAIRRDARFNEIRHHRNKEVHPPTLGLDVAKELVKELSSYHLSREDWALLQQAEEVIKMLENLPFFGEFLASYNEKLNKP